VPASRVTVRAPDAIQAREPRKADEVDDDASQAVTMYAAWQGLDRHREAGGDLDHAGKTVKPVRSMTYEP